MSEEPQEKLPKKQPSPKPKSIQPQQVREIAELVEMHIERHRGPLPRPQDLQEYDNVVPGAAERIIRMAEKQSTHRQELERKVVFGDSRRAFCGLWVGGFVVLCVLAGAVYLIDRGHDVAGAIIAGIDVVGLVSVFIYGTVSRRTERIKKSATMQEPSDTEDS
jgi:uncharacterized membrane protein